MPIERKLRLLQIACILYVLVSFYFLDKYSSHSADSPMNPAQWFVVVGALHCAVVSFPLRSWLVRAPKEPRARAKSTAEKRWIAGNVVHLGYSTSVCVWVFVLQYLGGQTWIIRFLFAVSLLSLLVWTPGKRPMPAA